MPVSDGLARRVVDAGRRCSLTTSVLEEWARRGTPRQVEYLAGYLEAERDSRDASRRAQLLRRCGLPAPKTFDGSDWSAVSWPGRLDREASQIGRAALLVIDELGFLPLDADGARLVFQVFADAYERQSVVITTNLEFSRWGSVFGDDQMAAAVIDRIVHHGRLVQFKGESYRVRHALM